MSASPTARQAYSHAIPVTKKVLISDPNQMPDVYSSTPGGTLYSTTPGGTKLIYERNFMKNLRNSPMSQTPPHNIPTCLLRGTPKQPFRKCVPAPEPISKTSLKIEDHQEQFQLEL